MHHVKSVFIVEPANQGWIIERLMRDVLRELEARGVKARIGKGAAYCGEEVILNARFLTAFSDERARINSLFITHVDDRIKELELKAAFARFNSFVCMSPQDADYVTGLKGDRRGVVGIELPTRALNVRPIRLALFSARYEDGRKNEQWIIDYFRDKSREERNAFTFCFLGWGWEGFCAQLAEMEMNYEIYRYSRFTPGEYELYKAVLPTVDVLIYLGFDGGAMSVYDAISAGINVLASNVSYHRGLGDSVVLFDDRDGFFREMDHLQERHARQLSILNQRSITTYTDRLLGHWGSLLEPDMAAQPMPAGTIERQELATFRASYKPVSVGRIRSGLIRWVQRRFIRY